MRRARRAGNLRRLKGASAVVEVTVEELILHGFQPSERYAISDGLTSELGRLLLESAPRSLPRQDDDLPAIDAGRINLPASPRPGAVGAQVAEAIFNGIQASSNHGG